MKSLDKSRSSRFFVYKFTKEGLVLNKVLMKNIIFEGVATALITPFNRLGAVDYGSLKRLIKRQIALGANAVVVLGTTGEASTLTEKERDGVISAAVEEANGKVPIIAGVGSNDTAVSLKRNKRAKLLGADGGLAVAPYYNKTTQNGLIAHFFTVADGGLPIILYNAPSRCGVNIEPETYYELAKHPNIVGVKEAGDSTKNLCELSIISDKLAIYAGNDDSLIPVIGVGGKGVVSVVSNIIPDKLAKIYRLLTGGKAKEGKEEYFKYLKLIKLLFSEVNPIPVKYALSTLGLCDNRLRLPLLKMQNVKPLKKELKNLREEIIV